MSTSPAPKVSPPKRRRICPKDFWEIAKTRKLTPQEYWDQDHLPRMTPSHELHEYKCDMMCQVLLASVYKPESEGKSGYQYSYVFVSPVREGPVRELFRIKIHKIAPYHIVLGCSAAPCDQKCLDEFWTLWKAFLKMCPMWKVTYDYNF